MMTSGILHGIPFDFFYVDEDIIGARRRFLLYCVGFRLFEAVGCLASYYRSIVPLESSEAM